MKNGQAKHSTKLTVADLPDNSVANARMKAWGLTPVPDATLAELQAKPGFYVMFKPHKSGGDLKGPFVDESQATEACREWTWEAKHS